MITRLVNPSTSSTLFSTDQLPDAVHGPVLKDVVTPIVHSESMIPTVRKGDGLELREGIDLKIGDVVVYRHDRLFICHRVHRLEGRHIFLRGDANTGPLEKIDIHHVVGRVERLCRDGKQFPVPPWISVPTSRADFAWTRIVTRGVTHGRSLARNFIQWLVHLPGLHRVFRIVIQRWMTVEIMQPARLHSFAGYLSRQRLHLKDVAPTLSDQSTSHDDGIVLVVRLGSFHLGTCTLVPWSIHMRPFFQSTATEVLLASLEHIRSRHTSRDSLSRSASDS